MTASIKITTLGKLLIERDGMVLDDFVSSKAELLFVYLAMQPGEHSRKKLAAMFWSETSDEQALKNLRTVLSSIRQQVGDALIATRDDLAADTLTIDVDAARFEEGFRTIFSSPGTLDLFRSMQELEALYQGDFLSGIAVRDAEVLDAWIDDEQRQLQELYRHLLLEMVEIASRQGSHTAGLPYAWKLISLDPLSDVAERHLMRMLAYADRANEALQHYERFVALLDEELGVGPEAETTDLYEQIRQHEVNPPKSTSMALPDMPYVEPAEDIELAQRMLNTPHCRLLTVYGISGIGKTALVTQLAFHRQHRHHGGSCFVDLTTAQSTRDMLHLTACVLSIPFSATTDELLLENALIDHLKGCHMLLVFDNYEQLLPEVRFVQRILQETNDVQVIVTSHTPLNLYREWLLPLKGLRVPDADAEDPQSYESVQLFELTARRINPRFDLSAAIDDVVRICQLVDSLPLGIVIAAGWVQIMSPAEIYAMMQQDLLHVEAVHRDFPSRHQSFQSLLNSMLSHLSAQEQSALICLSIFDGSFDMKAALAVANVGVRDFKSLTDKCLVQRSGEFRYLLHNVMRQAFRAQLEGSPLLKDAAARFVAYFRQWCDDFYDKGLPLHELMTALDIEQHNLWTVAGLTETERQRFILHIAPAMHEYWVNRGYHAKGLIQLLQGGGNNPEIAAETRIRGLITLGRILERTSQYDLAWSTCEQVLAMENDLNLPEIRARALRVLSEICVRRGDYAAGSEYLQQIIAMQSPLSGQIAPHVERLIFLAYEDLGEMRMQQGEYETARHYIEIALRRWIEQGETLRQSIAQSYLGVIALKKKETERAFRLFDTVLLNAKAANNQTLIAIFSTHLGVAAIQLGDYHYAFELLYNALQIAIQIDRKVSIVLVIEHLSQLALCLESNELGAQLFGFSLSMREHLSLPVTPHNQPDHERLRQMLMERLGSVFEWHCQTGHGVGLNAAAQLAASLMASLPAVPT